MLIALKNNQFNTFLNEMYYVGYLLGINSMKKRLILIDSLYNTDLVSTTESKVTIIDNLANPEQMMEDFEIYQRINSLNINLFDAVGYDDIPTLEGNSDCNDMYLLIKKDLFIPNKYNYTVIYLEN